jgi:hypothetical protein
MTEVMCSSDMLVPIHQSICCHNSEDHNMNPRGREYLQPCNPEDGDSVPPKDYYLLPDCTVSHNATIPFFIAV